MKHSLVLAALLSLMAMGCRTGMEPGAETPPEIPDHLPFQQLELSDLSAFRPVAANWSIAGGVVADHTQNRHLQTFEGSGVLVNQNSDDARDNLLTTWEHGDIELDIEVLMPKGSNSGIYFQGRYEIQLFDSWQKEEPRFSDLGGIYQRWDPSRPDGQKGYEGHAPPQNAAKAPGLWQHFYISFRAPRFDATGNKVENARFEKVVLNGVVLHENVEVTGPTRASMAEDEVPLAPLMLQGDHGPVAFRNIRYKLYGFDTLALRNIRYAYYKVEDTLEKMPDFDSLELVEEGMTDSLIFQPVSQEARRTAYIFDGQLEVPRAGDYLFHLYSYDGSQLFIDGEMAVDHDGKHGFTPKAGLVQLAEGTHELQIKYFNDNRRKGLLVEYEGPEIRRQQLYTQAPAQRVAERPALAVEPKDAPEMVRSFLMHKGEKLPHVLSVGDPTGVHYSVDLRRGALLQCWRGGFADVTDMWYQRGQPQLLAPLSMSVELNAGLIAAILDNENSAYPDRDTTIIQFKGYDINGQDEPVFLYAVGPATVLDHYQPAADSLGLIRTIRAEKAPKDLYARIAVADYITDVGNGYYSIGGQYLLGPPVNGPQPIIRQSEGRTEMLFPLTPSANEVKYSILW